MTRQEAIQVMIDAKAKSPAFLQKVLKITYEEAKKICDGIIIKKENIYLDRMNEYLRKWNEIK